jgi:hypothetical protein
VCEVAKVLETKKFVAQRLIFVLGINFHLILEIHSSHVQRQNQKLYVTICSL